MKCYLGKKSLNEIKKSPKIDDSIRYELSKSYDKFSPPRYKVGKKDIENIDSEFLIDNIESAFEAWHHSPFLKNMAFDEFKESILPYRTNDETLIFKRSQLRNMFYNKLNFDKSENIYTVIEWFKTYIDKMQRISLHIHTKDETGFYDLFFTPKEFNCFYNVSWV